MDTTMTTACGSEGAPIPRATYRNAPANRVSEIVDGTLYVNPRLDPLRTLARSRPGAGLSHAYWFGRGGGPREWWIMFEPQLRLGADILVPDWAGWRREPMAELPDASFFTLAPDWVCEVLSPSTRKLDLHGPRPGSPTPPEPLVLTQQRHVPAARDPALGLPPGTGVEIAQPPEIAVGAGLENEHVDLVRRDADGRLVPQPAQALRCMPVGPPAPRRRDRHTGIARR